MVAILMAQWGCANTEPTKFYVLNSLKSTASEVKTQKNTAPVVLGIGPLKLPEYLDQPQILTSSGGNELEYSEFHHWAEPLKDNFSRVLGENLSVLIPTNQIHLFPWRRSAGVNYHLEFNVIDFQGNLGGDSILNVRWALYGKEGGKALVLKKSTYSQSTSGEGFEAMVLGMNLTLEQFSRDIVKSIRPLLPPAK